MRVYLCDLQNQQKSNYSENVSSKWFHWYHEYIRKIFMKSRKINSYKQIIIDCKYSISLYFKFFYVLKSFINRLKKDKCRGNGSRVSRAYILLGLSVHCVPNIEYSWKHCMYLNYLLSFSIQYIKCEK